MRAATQGWSLVMGNATIGMPLASASEGIPDLSYGQMQLRGRHQNAKQQLIGYDSFRSCLA
jgi:hypothetical protein